MMYVVTIQQCKFYANISMNVFATMNTLTTQLHRCYTNISMNISTNTNIITMQQCRFYASSSMIVFPIAKVTTTQRCKRCTYDSPGLTSESEVYPGSFAVRGNNAVGVVPFILRHFIAAFHAEKVQHLRR